jgi:cell pole-organizing protein PopZ
MAQAAKNQEPSMEEILASIRRIIAEDDPEKPAQHSAKPAGLEPAHSSLASAQTQPESQAASAGALGGLSRAGRSATILELTEPTATPAVRPAEPDFALDQAPRRPSPPDHAPSAEALSMTQDDAQADEHGGLVSGTTSAAVDSAFSALAQTVLVHNARTLEDLVREMLRPMLKVWLDDNLPGMVERLVRAEIERVSRGRGG